MYGSPAGSKDCQALNRANGARAIPDVERPSQSTARLPDTRLIARFQKACRQAAATIKAKAVTFMRNSLRDGATSVQRPGGGCAHLPRNGQLTGSGRKMPPSFRGGRMTRADKTLTILLRVLGVSALFALVAVFTPLSWMAAAHHGLGLGEVPPAPVVEYVARSVSAFYALYGALCLVVASDLERYRPLVRFLGMTLALMGLVLLGVD